MGSNGGMDHLLRFISPDFAQKGVILVQPIDKMGIK